jgi:hypothetical protein
MIKTSVNTGVMSGTETGVSKGVLICKNIYNKYSDIDAKNFMYATGISDNQIKDAIYKLCVDLKMAGLWDFSIAIYPFVGGEATYHKFNLKNPQDTNAAYRLTFSGGWTHNQNGITGNGTNTLANTYINASTALTQTSMHISYYSRTANTSAAFSTEISVNATFSNANWLALRTNNKTGGGNAAFSAGTDSLGTSVSNTLPGFFIGTRPAASNRRLFRNATQIAINTTTDSANLPNANITIGGSSTSFSANNCAFSSIGGRIFNADVINYNAIVQNFQTILGRNV